MDQSLYLQRYAHPIEFLVREPVPGNLGMIITIPCFNEPALNRTLEAIHACQRPDCDVEVIVLINEPEQVNPEIHLQNERCFQEAHQWARWHQAPSFKYYILWIKNLPEKWSGVGLARKMAMDEAVRRFRRAGNQEGIIVCLDADSTCRENYLVTLKQEFARFNLNAASIHFEHPLEGDEDPEIYEGIIRYELHLRYYILAQQIAGFPYAFHAIGSSMAVRNDVYEKQGGMNRRKAGEDFYFLHKIIPLGQFKEITATTVIPSPRESDRVPFGTGKAMLDWMNKEDQEFLTYSPGIFEILAQFFSMVNGFYESTNRFPEIPTTVQAFLGEEDFVGKIRTFREQSTRITHFRDKFFRWFNGLKLLQYVHHAQSTERPAVPLPEAVKWLGSKLALEQLDPRDLRKSLLVIREFNRNNPGLYRKK